MGPEGRGAARSAKAITARRLLHWGDLDERRKRAATGVGRLRWPLRVVAGGGLAAAIARQAQVDPDTAALAVRAAIVAASVWAMLGAPFRLFWRPDAPLLARLPIPGGALFDVALIRSARATAAASVLVVPAIAALAVASPALAARHLALWGAVVAAAALLLPAVTLGAGAIVAGGKAAGLIRAVSGGEVPLPATGWLGALPGFAAAGVVLSLLAAGPWASGASDVTAVGPPAALLGGIAGAAVVAALAARRAAPAVMPQAVREVAALDVQRLAHLEIHPPTALERAVGGRLGARARLVHAKDARLLRRRFPLALLVGAATTAALWICAAVGPAAAWPWALAVTVGFVGYGQLIAWRLVTRPVELPYVRTLPVAPADLRRAKLAYLATWMLLYPIVGVIPVAARGAEGLALAGGVVLAALGGVGLGARLVARLVGR